jgi:hypothetical protein
MTQKMTKKAAFVIAQNALESIETEEARQAWDVIQKEIERLERTALKAKTTETKADKAKAEFRQTVLELVADNGNAMRAGDVAQALEVSVQKAAAALNALVAEGALRKVDGEKRTVLFATIEG